MIDKQDPVIAWLYRTIGSFREDRFHKNPDGRGAIEILFVMISLRKKELGMSEQQAQEELLKDLAELEGST